MTITRFPTATLPDGCQQREPDPVIVEFLERALTDAKAGQIVAVAIASVRPTGHVRTGWEVSEAWGHHLTAACTYLRDDISEASRGANTIIDRGDSSA